jgi:hypothetical protein
MPEDSLQITINTKDILLGIFTNSLMGNIDSTKNSVVPQIEIKRKVPSNRPPGQSQRAVEKSLGAKEENEPLFGARILGGACERKHVEIDAAELGSHPLLSQTVIHAAVGLGVDVRTHLYEKNLTSDHTDEGH